MIWFRAVEQQKVGPVDPLQEAEFDARPNKTRGDTVNQSQGRSPGPVVKESVCVEAN